MTVVFSSVYCNAWGQSYSSKNSTK